MKAIERQHISFDEKAISIGIPLAGSALVTYGQIILNEIAEKGPGYNIQSTISQISEKAPLFAETIKTYPNFPEIIAFSHIISGLGLIGLGLFATLRNKK
ncbi:MAG: hypothetical protein Fur009_7140 [Candidatus Microgenomates bacterium]